MTAPDTQRQAILDQVRAQTTLDVDEDDFQDLLWFLSSNQLLRVGTPHDSARFAALARARRQRWRRSRRPPAERRPTGRPSRGS